MLKNPGMAEEQRAEAERVAVGMEENFNEMHEEARRRVQQAMREGEIARPSDAAEFLNAVWNKQDMLEHFTEAMWRALGMDGQAPVAALLRIPIWRIFLDTEGYAVYVRGVVRDRPRRVHRLDLLQLIYAGVRDRRIVVSADEPLLEAAHAILVGRYPQSRVLHARDFIVT